ncbi:YncE family protein [Lysobacter sp. TY2-98]|uniref:YncE family protein n=1 Tax=Lysobacter sp. TY2-98 TaxID=2290922 RepID=UPI000E1FD4A3|nr:YncE family protein [Lysobacter sp. TY2-98]AXK71194.1 YncE family protein [Lysobacter sp. TY2-98]
MHRALALACIIALGGCATSAARNDALGVTATWAVSGDGRWDLLDVDSGAHRLYVSRSNRVQVFDTTTGAMTGEVADTPGVHGIAIVPSLGRGFATDGSANRVTEFDLASLAQVRSIAVSGASPDAVIYDTASKHLFAFNAHSNSASVLDPVAGREVATIALAGNPELAASDGRGHVYVNLESRGEVVDIDTSTSKIAHIWALPDCEEPTGLAMDVTHARLFSACANGQMAVTDAHDGHAVARIPIGDGPDGLVFDAALGRILVPNGRSGTLTVIQELAPDRYEVAQTVTTAQSARTIALDPATHRAYLPAASFGPKPAGDEHARPPMLPGSFRIVVVAPLAAGSP